MCHAHGDALRVRARGRMGANGGSWTGEDRSPSRPVLTWPTTNTSQSKKPTTTRQLRSRAHGQTSDASRNIIQTRLQWRS
eukprot:6978279-Prymnesium_polylepis.1